MKPLRERLSTMYQAGYFALCTCTKKGPAALKLELDKLGIPYEEKTA